MNTDGNGFENNGGNPYRADKGVFSRIGFACLAALGLSFGLSILAYYLADTFFPGVSGQMWFYWTVHIVIMYGISIPAGILILRGLPRGARPDGARHLRAGEVFLAIVMCYPLMYAGNYIANMINQVLYQLTGRMSSSGLDILTGSSPLWVIFLVMVVIGPVMEELFFRKFLIDSLSRYGGGLAIWLSALVFGLFHGNLEQLIYATLLGAMLGFVYYRTRSLRSTVIMHMAVNFMGGFVPALIYRYVLDINKLNEMLAELQTYTNISPGSEEMKQLLGLYGEMIPGMACMMLYAGVICGLAIAGIVLLIYYRRRLTAPGGERRIERAFIGDTVFMAPGIILFILAAIAEAVYSLLSAPVV